MSYHFDKKKHVHTLDGKRLHGVTTVLKYWGDPGALINWAANTAVDFIVKGGDPEEARTAHTRKRDKAGDRGTKVHEALEVAMNELIETGGYSTADTPEYDIVPTVINWMTAERIKPLKSEMAVYSREHWYGGIADGVIEKDGKRYILDFKTSNTVQTKAFIQCGAYSVAVKEMKKAADVAGVVVVHIPKGQSFDPEKNTFWFYDIENLENAWLSILNAYKTDYQLQKLIQWKK